ncbi:hypothetical protein D9757_012054 [Collybiopsis confluens]|uniref:Polysaccharide biosynthesis domain-containing protein n=1 Tax=Collybiopsis confluens TaxID=2823264 RepID=A0A8H5D0M2_9AGAR|nr:hypothetical protein D9757_012054 [Collybiopsis confluens]
MAGKFEPQNAQNLVEVIKRSPPFLALDANKVADADSTKYCDRLKNSETCVCLISVGLPNSFIPQTYWNLLAIVPPKDLRLTKIDDEIFKHTMETFPELAKEPYQNLTKLDEDWMKSAEGKERWRVFIAEYEKKVKDHNFGSLIRTDARGDLSYILRGLVTRIQFYAIEISRNRLGLNDKAHALAKAEAEKEKLEKEAKDKEKEGKKKKKSSS